MFIRKTLKTEPKTGKKYFSYQLVESYRSPSGPRQQILLTIGSEIDLDDSNRKLLANRIEEIINGSLSLFSYPENIENLAHHYAKLVLLKKNQVTVIPEPVEDVPDADYQNVDINSIRHQKIRSVGCEHLAKMAYQDLGFDTLFARLGLSKKHREYAAGAIIGKALHPSSERDLHHWLVSRSALDEVLGTSFAKLSLDQLYLILDNIFIHKKTIEKHLREHEKHLFNLQETVILYDITNTFFEGACKSHPKAKRGKSKEKRSDCPLVSLGVVLDSDGFPKHTEIFDGNVNERATLQEMILRLNLYNKVTSPIIVMDSGIATNDNIQWLKENNYHYIVMMKKKHRPTQEEASGVIVNDKNGQLVTATLVCDSKTKENMLWCYSKQRQLKERDIKRHQFDRLEKALTDLRDGLKAKGKIKALEKVQQKIGRLREKYSRLAQYYNIDVTPHADGINAENITWTYDSDKIDQSFSGTYTLRTNVSDLSPESIWKIYMMLSEAESCFRCLKSEAGLRPNFHRREDRIESHIFVSVLAYHLIATVRKKLKDQGIFDSWSTIRKNLESHAVVTTIAKTKDQKTIYLRTTSDPDEYQRKIYAAVGIGTKPIKTEKTIIYEKDVVSNFC